jgi:hypothetical protein
MTLFHSRARERGSEREREREKERERDLRKATKYDIFICTGERELARERA